MPEIDFPVFPALVDATPTDNGVLVSEDWIFELTEYRLKIAQTERLYKGLKEIYENE